MLPGEADDALNSQGYRQGSKQWSWESGQTHKDKLWHNLTYFYALPFSAAEKEMRGLNNSYYRQGHEGHFHGIDNHKHYWKVEVTGFILSSTSWLHTPKTKILWNRHTQKIHNGCNENSNSFRLSLTYGVCLMLHYFCEDKNITAAFVSK